MNDTYDMRVNPAYQVEYTKVATGKLLSASKRRLTWRFGFSDVGAIKNGLRGSSCRGSEHEVNFIWSLKSGKREIKSDGVEVHFSIGKVSDVKFEASWRMRGGQELKVIALAAHPSLLNQGVEQRQYDLLLDGISYFDLPNIHDLGQQSSHIYGANVESRMDYATDGINNNRISYEVASPMNPVRASSAPDMLYQNQAIPRMMNQPDGLINDESKGKRGMFSKKAKSSHGMSRVDYENQIAAARMGPMRAVSTGALMATSSQRRTTPQQSNQVSTNVFDRNTSVPNFHSYGAPIESRNPPINQPPISQWNNQINFSDDDYKPFVPINIFNDLEDNDSPTFNAAQGKRMQFGTPQSEIYPSPGRMTQESYAQNDCRNS